MNFNEIKWRKVKILGYVAAIPDYLNERGFKQLFRLLMYIKTLT